MIRVRLPRRLLCLMILMPAAIGARSAPKAKKPCGDLCVFIRAVLKERKDYAKFKGDRLIGDEKETVFDGTFKPSGDAHCRLVTKSQSGAADYSCFFGYKPGFTGTFPFDKARGREKHAELVQALKAALPDWEFKDIADKSIFGAKYVTVAAQAATHARVSAVLAFMGEENDEDTSAEVSLQFD